jgi:hypothetical protein
VNDKRVGAAVPNPDRLVNEVVGLRRLLGNGVDGVLEDLSLPPGHSAMLGLVTVSDIARGHGR